MIHEIALRLRQQLENELDQQCAMQHDPLTKMKMALKLTRDAMAKLKLHFSETKFKDRAEEIPIFKIIKPSFYQWNIYYTELYYLESGLLNGDIAKTQTFLEAELSYINRFFKQYAFLYQYYLLGADEMDNLYFVRGEQTQSVLLPNVPELEPEFSTSCDYLFSKFMAYEKLKGWILERLTVLKSKAVDPQQLLNLLPADEMHWTGDTIDLAEIGLGLYHTGKLNSGKAGLGEIFRWLEEHLHVSIGVPAKRMAELKRRKRLSRTRFLNEMRDNLNRRMDSDDEYVPTGKKKDNSTFSSDD